MENLNLSHRMMAGKESASTNIPVSNIVISEEDGMDLLDNLLAADSPIAKVQCTEDDDLDLDELLRKKDDDDDDERVAQTNLPHKFLSTSPPPSSSLSPLRPLRPLSGGNIFFQGNQQDTNKDASIAAAMQLPPSTAPAASDRESETLSPESSPTAAVKQSIISSPTARSPIFASEDEGDEGVGHWINPPPAHPGDFLNNSIRRVPSKSILKKVSSYGNFEAPMSPGKSKGKKSIMNSETSAAMSTGNKKSSFLSFSMGSTTSNHSENSGGSSYGVGLGLDLGDSSSMHTTRSISAVPESKNICTVDENSVHAPIVASFLPPVPILTSNSEDADRAAGLTSNNSSDLSSSGKKMNRSVSFVSVDVREYDRTIGDNPSCRSGPPLSLDWSYSKKYEQPKALDEYEKEREPDRVHHLNRLHVNKYRRRNLLSFHWGHSEEEMKSARQETKKLQRQRSLTQVLLPIHMAEEAFISVKSFVAKKRGKAECPKQELERVTSELSASISKSTNDTSHHDRRSFHRTYS